MVTKNGTRAAEDRPSSEPVHTTSQAAQRKLDKAVGTARALILEERGTVLLVQDGKVYLEDAICAGCGKVGCWIVDDVDTWCPSCGGVALIHLDVTEPQNFDNGLCRIGTSAVIHLVAPPVGEHPVCLPNSKVGRMKPVVAPADTEATCKRCLAAATGSVFGTYERTIPARGAGSES